VRRTVPPSAEIEAQIDQLLAVGVGENPQALDDAVDERDGKQRLQGLVDELDGAGYTAAAKCLADDLDALVVHLRYPTRHRRRWRSTNLLERSLAEVKRRTKVMGRFPGETSCLTLV
jgi:putative transposase